VESFIARQNRIGRTFVSADALLATVREFAAELRSIRAASPASLDREFGDREEGHIQFSEPSATNGYFRNPDDTRGLFYCINDLAVSLIGMPVDNIVLASPHAVLKTSSDKIRWTASCDPYERDAKTGACALW